MRFAGYRAAWEGGHLIISLQLVTALIRGSPPPRSKSAFGSDRRWFAKLRNGPGMIACAIRSSWICGMIRKRPKLFGRDQTDARCPLCYSADLTSQALTQLSTGLIKLWDRQVPLAVGRGVSWSVLSLVAGLFVIVEALDSAGGFQLARNLFDKLTEGPPLAANLATAFGFAVASNIPGVDRSGRVLLGGVLLACYWLSKTFDPPEFCTAKHSLDYQF